MNETPICPDCQKGMEVGVVPDYTSAVALQMRWFSGQPKERKILGMKVGEGQISVDWSAGLPVKTFRCPDCGLLCSYAYSACENQS